MQIRRARMSDLDAAAGLWRERAELLRQTDAQPGAQPQAELWRDRASELLRDSDKAMLVAREGEALAGYIAVAIVDGPPGETSRKMGEVTDAALDLHQAHPGVAGDLLDAARDWLRERGIDMLRVNVPAHYPVEAGFWLAQGARPRFVQHWLQL